MSVPDLGRLAEEALRAQDDPWKAQVAINGQPATVPIGIFVMLSEIAGLLRILNETLQQLAVQQIVAP